MQLRYLVALIVVLLIATLAGGLNCSLDPFAVPFQNVSILSNPDEFAAHRGIAMEIGSLDKRLSLNIGTTINSTFLPDGDAVCNPFAVDSRRCVFWRGGVFTPKNSSSWRYDTNVVAYNGSASNEGFDYVHWRDYNGQDPISQFPRGWDTVQIDDKDIFGYPLTIIDNSSFPFGSGMIGLASDSQFLEAAIAANLTPSSSWGFDYGTTGIYSPGELVIGGYNSAKATYDTFENFTVFPNRSIPCPLQVNVSSVRLGGNDLNTGMFTACVEPAMWTMILPLEVQENFDTELRQQNNVSFWKRTWEYAYYNSTDGFPVSDMTITLDTGFSVTIPTNELYNAARELLPQGGWGFIDGSIEATMGTADFPRGIEPLPQLGAPFLSQVYIVVDYESGIFSLAHTQRDSDGSGLIKLGCDATSPGPSENSPGRTSEGSTSTDPPDSPGIGTGPIVGAVLGSISGLALIAAVIFILMKRKKKAYGGDGEVSGETDVSSGTVISKGYDSELDAGPVKIASTLPVRSRNTIVETDGRPLIVEMP